MDDPAAAQVEQLALLLPSVWDEVVRATRRREQLPTLPASEVAALREVSAAADGLTPAELATSLGLARPTVSNLLRSLVAAGLLERHPSSADRRSVQLIATPRARHVLAAFSRGRIAVLTDALAGLSGPDRARIESALPALAALHDQLRHGVSDRP